MTRRILFVGGDQEIVAQLTGALHQEPYKIAAVNSVEEARSSLAQEHASVVVAQEKIGQIRGADFLAELQKQHPTTVRIMITGEGDRSALIDAVNQAEIYRFLSPPLAASHLAKVLRDALNIARVAEAQEAVWIAAKQQQDALQKLVSKDVSSDEAESALTAARFAGLSTEGSRENDRIGELPQEHANRLSTRENEIVQALGTGRRVKDIAQDLVISTHTVRNHLKAIYRKLNVRSQFELISLMARHSREQ